MRRMLPCLALALAGIGGPLEAVTVTLEPVADTTLYEENPDASDAKGPGIFTGRVRLTFIRRALVRFDVASAIPAGATINSARLDLVVTRTQGNPVDVLVFRALAGWGEGTSNAGEPGGSGTGATPGDATWTQRVYPGTAWTTPGGDASPAFSATSPIGTPLGLYSFGPNAALTSDVQGWLDAPATNFGWLLRADELQAPPSARRWGSRESVNAAERPRLTISYTPLPDPGPRAPDDVPALSPAALLALGLAVAGLGALALRR